MTKPKTNLADSDFESFVRSAPIFATAAFRRLVDHPDDVGIVREMLASARQAFGTPPFAECQLEWVFRGTDVMTRIDRAQNSIAVWLASECHRDVVLVKCAIH